MHDYQKEIVKKMRALSKSPSYHIFNTMPARCGKSIILKELIKKQKRKQFINKVKIFFRIKKFKISEGLHEGCDKPVINSLSFIRETYSLSMYMQSIGRAAPRSEFNLTDQLKNLDWNIKKRDQK